MIERACISINNRCNLNCTYCHFHTPNKVAWLKESEMNMYEIFDNIIQHITKYNIKVFKLGFVGNGEPLLEFDALSQYIEYISDYLLNGKIAAYTITNGTLVNEAMLKFFTSHNVNVGFSIDGIAEIHNRLRCNSHAKVMNAIEMYHSINGQYPSLNCTVGQEILKRVNDTIEFFESFNSRITFSCMIGENGITLEEFHDFLSHAKKKLNIRTGGYDCTMYGGKCGAGINNIFYANGKVYLCGNCVDLPPIGDANTPLDMIIPCIPDFDRNNCYHEIKLM